MACAQTDRLSNDDYLRYFNQKVASRRIPISGSLDLTRQCNLRCVHCYLGNRAADRNDLEPELNTAQWIDIIDQIAEAGCLYLLITGGEPLLRKDFNEVYTRAKSNGLVVTIFSNGTLIDDDVLALFEDFPPHAVEISLYGASEKTYEKITGVRGSYGRCLNNVKRLLDRQIRTKLKTILMTHNRHEFNAIQSMAEMYNVDFRFDAAIFPTLDGNKAPVDLRVSPKAAVEIELSDQKRLLQWQDLFCKMKNRQMSDSLYTCGTGLTSFHIDPYGNLQPCLMVNSLKYNIARGHFSEGWHDVIPNIRKRKAGRNFACQRCEKMVLCGYCPAFFELETRKEETPSKYLCAMGQHRFKIIERKQSSGDSNGS